MIRSLWICCAFGLFWTVVYGATDYLTALHDVRLHIHLPFEPAIPLVPAMAIPYLTLGVLFLLAPFMLPDWRELVPLAVTCVVETLVAAVCFLLLPVELAFPPAPAGDDGIVWTLYRLADTMNLDYNALPSLHVAYSLTMAEVYGARIGTMGRVLFRSWAATIAVAAVLIHAHHLADVVAGAVLAAWALRRVLPRTQTGAFLDAVQLEWVCLREFAHFTRRHLRYGLLFVGVYARCLLNFRATRVVRAGYCLLQHLDDVADGDRDVGVDPDAYLRHCADELARDHFARGSVASVLAAHTAEGLRAAAADGEDPIALLLRLIEVLRRDLARRTGTVRHDAAWLRAHHRETFSLSVSLTLIGTGSPLRAEQAQALVDALAWCSPIRDLGEDLQHGIINVPQEVLDEIGCAEKDGSPALTDLREHPAFRAWLQGEAERGGQALDAFAAALPGLRGERGSGVLRALYHALRSYQRRYQRSLPA